MMLSRKRNSNAWITRLLWVVLALLGATTPLVLGDPIAEQFQSPPDSAKPRVWWHWVDGNVSEEGIAADLQWMNRIGIGGVHVMDVGLGAPKWIDDRKPYMSPEWKKAFLYSVSLAARDKMEFGIFSSPGWSITGGPQVKPEQAMKKMVWSEARIEGGKRFKGTLPGLPLVTGPFQNVPKTYTGSLVADGDSRQLPQYHQDTIVIAYPELSSDTAMPVPKVQSSFDISSSDALFDSDSATGLTLPAPEGKKPQWIKLDYGRPVAVRSMTVSVSPPGSIVNLALSDDGKTFRHLQTFYMGLIAQTTVDMEPITARYFRFSFPDRKLPTDFFSSNAAPGASREGLAPLFGVAVEEGAPTVIHDLALRRAARVNRFEQKAGFEMAPNYYALDTPTVPANHSVASRDVIDLTELVQDDGYLEWDAPPGNWVVLRMGYSLTGSMNHAAPSEGTGLEVDKLNRDHVRHYVDTYLQSYEAILGPTLIGKRGLNAFVTDSLEVGLQNWTEDILQQFERLRGYNPRPWLPSLTGIVVDSAEKSDRFLWDFRRTIADLMLDSHYKVISDAVRAKGLTLYGEALESNRYFPGDDMDYRRYTDIPTAAMWMFSPQVGPQPGLIADIAGAASVANVYGKKLVAAESLTGALAPWAAAPRDMKPVVDLEFALGINRPILHSSVHQPRDDRKPGLSLSIFGQYFNRHETWAELAKPWMDYLGRSAYLLQQGKYCADIAFFYGEETPLSVMFSASLPTDIPYGHGYDFVNADAILTQMSVEDGRFVTRSGMDYRLLYLGGTSQRMTLAVLKKLRDMVSAGGVVVGSRPLGSPSLADNEPEFQDIVAQMWGEDTQWKNSARKYGDGYIFTAADVGAALEKLQIDRDFEFSPWDASSALLFNHRKFAQTDIYFVSNQTDRAVSVEATFRVSGKRAELWHAEDGRIEGTSFRIKDSRTTVPLELGPFDAVFVVFRENTKVLSQHVSRPESSVIAELDNSWRLSFIPDGGALTTIENVVPGSWSESGNMALRYFSGTATYTTEFNVSDSWIAALDDIVLDLGDVRELAEVAVNSQSLGILWKPPYRVDVTGLLTRGRNTLEIKVTNLWANQLIGDLRPGREGFSATSVPAYVPRAKLKSSGLLGPVTLEKLTLQ